MRVLIEDLRPNGAALLNGLRLRCGICAYGGRGRSGPSPLTVPGIGYVNATALTAAVGHARSFGRGRDLAAWLSLTPRQATIEVSRDCLAYPNAATGICERT